MSTALLESYFEIQRGYHSGAENDLPIIRYYNFLIRYTHFKINFSFNTACSMNALIRDNTFNRDCFVIEQSSTFNAFKLMADIGLEYIMHVIRLSRCPTQPCCFEKFY